MSNNEKLHPTCRFNCPPYIYLHEGRNYMQYTLIGCVGISAKYWKSFLSKETELTIDTRGVGGEFSQRKNVVLSYDEFKTLINEELGKFGVVLK